MHIAIVEDTPGDYQILRACVDRYVRAHELGARVDGFQSAASFIASFRAGRYDLVFLDCYLDEAGLVRDEAAPTGLDIARRIRTTDESVRIFFITSSRDFAVESYEVQASGYLMKPVQYDDLALALDRFGIGASKERTVEIGGESFDANRLRWARVVNHTVELHVGKAEPIHVRATLTQLEEALADTHQFCSPARGYLVNLDTVESVQDDSLVVRDDVPVPISRRNFQATLEAWGEWVSQRDEGEAW